MSLSPLLLIKQSLGYASCSLYFSVQVCVVASCCLTLCDPMDCSPPSSSVHGIPRQEHWRGLPFPFPEDLSCPDVDPASPALASRFFTTEPPGKPEVTDLLFELSDPRATLITYYPPAIRKNILC